MPKIIDEKELADILNAIIKRKQISISQLQATLPITISKRTLQRRLALLVRQKKITVINAGPERHYQYLPIITDSNMRNYAIDFSKESQAILHKIKQPLHKRKPVGYQRAFLDAYRPNKTYYLPEKARAHLLRLGKIIHQAQPAGTYAKEIFQRLLIDLSWNSSRLEGNTYSLLETQRLLDLGKIAQGKDQQETQMILNHKNAISLLVEE